MEWIQTLSTVAGLISLGVTFVGGFYLVRSGVSKSATEAQQSAISALQAELATLRGRVGDAEKERVRLEHTIETICAALLTKGMVITIQGEMVNIQEGKMTTTTRIRGKIHSVEEP
jgi:F0F1-type ATP synthase alpha subunit